MHSAATLSHVHSNIWAMTVLLVDGALRPKSAGNPLAVADTSPRTASETRLRRGDMLEAFGGEEEGREEG